MKEALGELAAEIQVRTRHLRFGIANPRPADAEAWARLCVELGKPAVWAVGWIEQGQPEPMEWLKGFDPRKSGRSHRILHALWTKAVGTPGYDKAEWRELEAAIVELRECTSEPPP